MLKETEINELMAKLKNIFESKGGPRKEWSFCEKKISTPNIIINELYIGFNFEEELLFPNEQIISTSRKEKLLIQIYNENCFGIGTKNIKISYFDSEGKSNLNFKSKIRSAIIEFFTFKKLDFLFVRKSDSEQILELTSTGPKSEKMKKLVCNVFDKKNHFIFFKKAANSNFVLNFRIGDHSKIYSFVIDYFNQTVCFYLFGNKIVEFKNEKEIQAFCQEIDKERKVVKNTLDKMISIIEENINDNVEYIYYPEKKNLRFFKNDKSVLVIPVDFRTRFYSEEGIEFKFILKKGSERSFKTIEESSEAFCSLMEKICKKIKIPLLFDKDIRKMI